MANRPRSLPPRPAVDRPAAVLRSAAHLMTITPTLLFVIVAVACNPQRPPTCPFAERAPHGRTVPGHCRQRWGLRVDAGRGGGMIDIPRRVWLDDSGQEIATYAVMLAVILVLVVATIRLIGSNANNVFSAAASSIN